MDILASWHRIPENAKHPIVIIVEDAELCNAEVLADFIITLRCLFCYVRVLFLSRICPLHDSQPLTEKISYALMCNRD